MDWNFDRELFEGDSERSCHFLTDVWKRCLSSRKSRKNYYQWNTNHTPDDNALVGLSSGLNNFWNLCGSSIGIAQGGLGKFLAQWMVHGQTELNIGPLDSRRFGPWRIKITVLQKPLNPMKSCTPQWVQMKIDITVE